MIRTTITRLRRTGWFRFSPEGHGHSIFPDAERARARVQQVGGTHISGDVEKGEPEIWESATAPMRPPRAAVAGQKSPAKPSEFEQRLAELFAANAALKATVAANVQATQACDAHSKATGSRTVPFALTDARWAAYLKAEDAQRELNAAVERLAQVKR